MERGLSAIAASRKPLTERSLGDWLRATLFALVLLTLAVSGVSLWANFERWKLNERVQHAQRDILRVRAFEEAFARYVAEVRGYVLFGDHAGRPRIEAARAAAAEGLEALRRGETNHGDAVARLKGEVAALFGFHDQVTALVSGADHRLAEEALRRGYSLERIAEIRALLRGIRLEDERTLAEHDADAAVREVRVWTIALGATLAQIALVALGLAVLRRELRRRAETRRALEASEARLRVLLSLAADWVWEQDADLRFTYFSERGMERGVVPAGAILGKRRWEVPGMEPAEGGWDAHRAMLERREPFHNAEIRTRQPDGSFRYLLVSGEPRFDRDGAFLGYHGTAHEITAQRRLEGEIRRSREELRGILDNVPALIARFERDGRAAFVNRAVCDTFELPADAVAGRELRSLIGREGWEIVAPMVERVLAGESPEYTRPHRRSDGSVRHLRFRFVPLRDDAGALAGWLSLGRDVTEEQQALEALAASEANFRKLVDASPEAIFVSRDGKLVFANAAAAALFGARGAADLVGRTTLDLVHPDSHAAVRERMRALAEGAKTQPRMEQKYLRLDGTPVDVEVASARFRHEGVRAVLSVARDIGARKAAERALRESNARMQLATDAANIAAWEWNSATRETAWASGREKLLGPRPASGAYPDFRDMVHEDDRERFLAAGRDALRDAGEYHAEFRLLRTDGEVRWVYARGKVLTGADGMQRIIGVTADIHARKRAEAERRLAERRMHIALDASRASIWETDLRTGEVYLSEGWARILGAEPAESRTTLEALMAMTHPDDLPRVAAASIAAMKGEALEFAEDHRVRAAGGEWIWVRTVGRVVEHDASGRALRMSGTNFDVTREKREQALLALEHDVTRLLAEATSASAGVQAALRAICASRSWEAARYFEADETAGLLRCRDQWTTADRALRSFAEISATLAFAPGAGIAGRVWQGGEPIWVQDIRSDARVLNRALETESGLHSLFSFPVTADGRTVGVVSLFSRQAYEPDARLIAAVGAIGAQLGMALKRKQAEERLALHARRAERVARFGGLALGETDPKRLFGEAVRAARGGEADVAMLILLSGGEFRVAAASGEPGERFVGESHPVAPDSMWPRLLESNAPHRIGAEYLRSRPVERPWRAWVHAMGSAIYAPVRGNGTQAMLALYSAREHAFGEADVNHATAVASVLSTALRRGAAEAGLREREREVRTLNSELEQRVAGRTAELQSALRDLESFSSAVSHDLRAPARRVAGFAGLLREELGAAARGEIARYLGVIETQAKEMSELVERLLELSRLSHRAIHPEPIDPATLAREAWESLDTALRERAELRVAELPPLEADRVLLKQVFVNLLGNALKFSAGRERPRIEVGARRDGDRVEYCVRDNGAGFDPAQAARLFRPFSRLHASRDFEGTGVGLSIVETIVRRHGGTVRAEGEPGRGAAFFFTLGAKP